MQATKQGKKKKHRERKDAKTTTIMRLNHTLARMTLWPETLWPGHFGQNDILARVTFWPRTLWPETLWPERQFGQCHFGW